MHLKKQRNQVPVGVRWYSLILRSKGYYLHHDLRTLGRFRLKIILYLIDEQPDWQH